MTLDSPLRASPADIMFAFSIADEPEAATPPLIRRVSRLVDRLGSLQIQLSRESARVVGWIKAVCRSDRPIAGVQATWRPSPPLTSAWTVAGRSEHERSRPYLGQIRSHFDCSSRPGEKRIA